MQVRAKFRVESVDADTSYNRVKLAVVTSGSKENESFFEATPWGQIEMGVLRPETAQLFEHGQEYYVDFSPAE